MAGSNPERLLTKPNKKEDQLDDLLARITNLTTRADTAPSAPSPKPVATKQSAAPSARPAGPRAPASPAPAIHSEPRLAGADLADDVAPIEQYLPREPRSWQEAKLNESEVEQIILKYLLARGEDSGHGIAEHVRLPFVMVEPVLRQMKQDQTLVYKGMTTANDYVCQLTEMGRERARRHNQDCTYYASAPVCLEDYVVSVKAQSLTYQRPTEANLKVAFQDLLLSPTMLNRLGPAINSGRGLFLHGVPGNGKTSIAERVTNCFGQYIWIPRALSIEGEIIRLFDPSHHHEVPDDEVEGIMDQRKYDRRWIRIRRPTIVVGGELTMDNLELSLNRTTGISEAPVQLKSNCGTLVIDDFGRQRMRTDELLNRWIVPLEKRYDFLNLASGKKVQVPFDQLIVFSTNLEPRELVDEAFLRRIPYKIEVVDPTENEFRELFMRLCPAMGIPYRAEALDYLIDTHYKKVGRQFRCCHPRDLLLQVRNYCQYRHEPIELTYDNLDFAIVTYFAAV
jgi:hypothetical protein